MSQAIIRAATFILAVASIGFTSCKKDKSGPGNNPGTQTKKITRIEENGITASTFGYNTDGTLKTVTTKLENNTVTFNLTYDAQKRPAEFVSNEGYKAKFIYQNNVLTLTENYEDGEKVSENSFTYENGKVKSNTLLMGYPQEGGNIIYKPVYRSVYTYYANGAVQKVSTYILNPFEDELELQFEYVYQEYDDKKNPLSVMADFSQVLMYQPVNVNNSKIEKLYNALGEIEETTQNVYTYDAAGYPVTLTSTVTPTGEQPTVKNVKFFY
jgi:antitoxin component YwqK of YwqJK toxin-antitoxin module